MAGTWCFWGAGTPLTDAEPPKALKMRYHCSFRRTRTATHFLGFQSLGGFAPVGGVPQLQKLHLPAMFLGD